jgi:hypothetical protein
MLWGHELLDPNITCMGKMNMDYPNLDGTVEYGASLQIVLTFSVKTNRKSSLEKLTLTYSLLKIMHYYCF